MPATLLCAHRRQLRQRRVVSRVPPRESRPRPRLAVYRPRSSLDEVCTGFSRSDRARGGVAAWRRARASRVYRPPYGARRRAREIARRAGARARRVGDDRARGVLSSFCSAVQEVDCSIKVHLHPSPFSRRTRPLGRSQQRDRQHSSKHLRLDAAGLLQPALGERRGELDALVHKALDSAGTGSLQLGVQVSSSV